MKIYATLLIPAAIALAATAAHADDVYEATFTGTFTDVNLAGADPGSFSDLGPGDSYALTITTGLTPRSGSGAVLYDAISLSLTIDDGVSVFDLTPADPGFISITHVPGSQYIFGLVYGIADAPLDKDARLVMLDDDGDPVRTDTDLPLTLDLDAFSGGRLFALTGMSLSDPDAGFPTPIANGTVDSFSARIIPSPAGGLLLPLGLLVTRRRARPAVA